VTVIRGHTLLSHCKLFMVPPGLFSMSDEANQFTSHYFLTIFDSKGIPYLTTEH